jgi:hypothetical protein
MPIAVKMGKYDWNFHIGPKNMKNKK